MVTYVTLTGSHCLGCLALGPFQAVGSQVCVPPCPASPSPSLLPLTTLSDVEMGSNPPASRVLRYKRMLHWPAFPFFLETILLCNSEWPQTHNLYFQDPSAQITGLCQRPRTVEPKSLRHL